jgi:hypothetical protein
MHCNRALYITTLKTEFLLRNIQEALERTNSLLSIHYKLSRADFDNIGYINNAHYEEN